MKFELSALAAVSMKTTLKYRRDWNKNGPTVQLLRKLMPHDKTGYRLYLPIGAPVSGKNALPPMAVRHALRVAGFRATDYLAKKCVKIKDKEQKNVYNIGKVIGKDPVAKAAFDNDPQLQNSTSEVEFQMVVSCHPYDIIGMSTGRDWDETSCMRLKDGRAGIRDGAYSEHLEHDVAEGTLVVYVIKADDSNLQKPLLRCLLKPFHNEEDKSIILYRRESRIYGNNVPGFAETLAKFMRNLNKGIPPGYYTLNRNLYEDGVGSDHNYIGSEAFAVPKWEDGNHDAILEERPQMFASYIQHKIDEMKKEDPDEWLGEAKSSLRQMFMYYINKMDAKYIKQAARVMATSPIMVQALYNYAVEGSDTRRLAELMRTKELREALKKVKRKPRAETNEDVRDVMTFFSQNIQKEYAHHLEEDYDIGVAAIKLLTDNIKLRTSDILSSPRLHSYVWYLADLCRNGLLYGVSVNQEAAHRLLAVLPKPEQLQISVTELADAMYGNAPVTMVSLLGIMYFNAVKANDEKLVSTLRKYVPVVMANTFKDRKFRRTFLAMPTLAPEISEMIQERISDGDLTPDAERDFIVHMKANGLDCKTWINLRQTLSSKEEWLPYLYYSEIEEDLGAIDYMLESRIRSFLNPWVQLEKPLVALNADQQLLFDFVGSALAVRDVPPTLQFEFKTDDILPKILASRHLLSTGASFRKYPQALDKHSAENIKITDFIGNDLGVSAMEAFEKGRSLTEAVRFMELVFRSCASSSHIALAMGPEGGTQGLPRARMMRIATRGGEVAVEGFKNGLAYCSKLLNFVETYPAYGAGRQRLLQEAYDFYKDTHTKEEVDVAFTAIRDVAYLFANEMDDLQERLNHMIRQFVNEDDTQADTYKALAKPVQLAVANWRDQYLTADGESS